jgi:hypothetical protein
MTCGAGRRAALSGQLGDLIAEGLGRPFKPSRVRPVPELPKTRSAKVLRPAVRASAGYGTPREVKRRRVDLVHREGHLQIAGHQLRNLGSQALGVLAAVQQHDEVVGVPDQPIGRQVLASPFLTSPLRAHLGVPDVLEVPMEHQQ